jgi:hypothetical protein
MIWDIFITEFQNLNAHVEIYKRIKRNSSRTIRSMKYIYSLIFQNIVDAFNHDSSIKKDMETVYVGSLKKSLT